VFYVYIFDEQMGPGFIKICSYFPYPVKVWVNGQYAERPAMPHKAEARLVALGSRMRETAFLWRLGRHDVVACPSLRVSVSHIDGTGERSWLLKSGASAVFGRRAKSPVR
jgi:hypothetical protein